MYFPFMNYNICDIEKKGITCGKTNKTVNTYDGAH